MSFLLALKKVSFQYEDWALLYNSSKFEIFMIFSVLRIHWRLSTILKTSNKRVWSNVFWFIKVYIFWKLIQYNIHADKTQLLKKSSDKINVFFLSRAPTHHSFIFHPQFFYKLKHKVRLSKTVCGFFRFDSVSFLWNFFHFCWTKCMDFLTLKRHSSFQNKTNRKATHSFSPRTMTFKLK